MRTVTSILSCLLLFAAAPAAAEIRLPDSPYGQGAQRFLDRLAERPEGGYTEAHVPEVFAPGIIERNGEQRLVMIMEMLHEDLFEASEPRLTELSRDGDHLDLGIQGTHMAVSMGLDLSPEHDFKVDGIVVDAGGGGPGLADVVEADAEGLAQLTDQLLDQLEADGMFNGAVLVAVGDQPIVARAVGFADRESQRPNTLDTPINLGSINKFITAIAAGQLAEQGLIDFDDTVGDHLPDFPLVAAREATLDQLLTHTAGLGDYFGLPSFFEGAKDEVDSVADLIPYVVEAGMIAEPGELNRYSNSGPVVMGLIIEAVSGQDYYDYVREHIYGPAGMEDSDSYAHEDEEEAGFAIGYHRERPGEPGEPDRGWHPRIGSPAGGGYASAEDLLRLSLALQRDELMSREMRETLWTPRAEMGPGFGYGYYTGVHSFDGGLRHVGHNGGAPGVSAEFRIFPELGVTVIVLANMSRAAAPLAEWLSEMVAANRIGEDD